MHFKHLLDNWQIFLFSAVFAAIGVLAILYPDALADFSPVGSRIIYRVILKFIWGGRSESPC
jgi:hypothetical protein